METAITYGTSAAIAGITWALFLTSAPRDMMTPIQAWIQNNPRIHPQVKHMATCAKCMSGQAALWGYPLAALLIEHNYSIYNHIASTALAIFLAGTYERWHKAQGSRR